ncbi:hypothetical protein [uncultured Campylobacter sp.]|uniref:hypothetical protein n=1 Tax=uncultured Campylobacter sp. TaxID=218934 RepID=UPI00260AEEDF|nr:hypothetical protein [uncultured Campylobacter sp.]
MNLNLKQKLFGSKLKKIVWLVVLFTAILGAAFIRIIPDYNKYKQGYCLKEDRILSKEERFKRGILDTLDRSVLFYAAITDRCYYVYDNEACNYGNGEFAVKVGFYETDKFNNDDWLEVLSKEYEIEKRKNQDAWLLYRNIFVEKFQMKPVNIAERLKINLAEGFAGFDMPVIEYKGLNKYLLYLDKSFILYDDFKFSAILVRVPEGYTPKDLLDRKQYYEREIQTRSYSEDDFKIDTCGNSDFKIYKNNAEEIADRLVREDLFKGG